MAVTTEITAQRASVISNRGNTMALEDRFEVLKEIGDGSFGSVVLARVRTAGASVARRGSVVAIKTMKKSFDSFGPCLELREVVFLRTLPPHFHLVPALDIFLDPFTKKLHIAMEHMEGNLYQLMKSRDHKCLDNASVKSILFQIMQGLEHIHAHNFFHRDIKPENILVSTSAHQETANSFRRYSSLVTPPSTPPTYTVKIADFGLARETHSKLPYTTYVSTRWYRAPEVLLRAGEYSAPVDIWAVGAMAVEVATLKPLFPGGNEVDQVWRVCEVMGSPGNWYNKAGTRVGGGDWRDGTRLASKLGFSFPKMAPHSMDTILQTPQWPAALSQFVTWCLMWDPKARPTSSQALTHEYFNDAVDPLRPKSSASKMLGRKQSDIGRNTATPPLTSNTTTKPSWFRKSLITRSESADVVSAQLAKDLPVVAQQPVQHITAAAAAPSPAVATAAPAPLPAKARPTPGKRATWTNGTTNAAPMSILPTIRPISPLSDTVTAQANGRSISYNDAYHIAAPQKQAQVEEKSKKIGRQLSVNSSTNHYADLHRQQAERALNGNAGLPVSPTTSKEGFFSHLRKRARRFSGRHQTPASPTYDDLEAQVGCGPWASNRSSMAIDSQILPSVNEITTYESLDKALRVNSEYLQAPTPPIHQSTSHTNLKRHHSMPQQPRSVDNLIGAARATGPISSRTRRAQAVHGVHQYEIPDEEDELLHDQMASARQNGVHNVTAAKSINTTPHLIRQSSENLGNTHHHHNHHQQQHHNPYPTPSPSANGNPHMFAEAVTPGKGGLMTMAGNKRNSGLGVGKWPTPPYEESEWAASASASIWAAGSRF